MDPMEFIMTPDNFKRTTMQAVANEARRLQREIDLERANQIASEVSKLFPSR